MSLSLLFIDRLDILTEVKKNIFTQNLYTKCCLFLMINLFIHIWTHLYIPSNNIRYCLMTMFSVVHHIIICSASYAYMHMWCINNFVPAPHLIYLRKIKIFYNYIVVLYNIRTYIQRVFISIVILIWNVVTNVLLLVMWF